MEIPLFKVRDGVDMLELLKKCGFTTYELRKQKIFGERTIQHLRENKLPSWEVLNFICDNTLYEPWEIIEYVRENEDSG